MNVGSSTKRSKKIWKRVLLPMFPESLRYFHSFVGLSIGLNFLGESVRRDECAAVASKKIKNGIKNASLIQPIRIVMPVMVVCVLIEPADEL